MIDEQQQAAIFDRYAPLAPALLATYLDEHAEFITDLARERLLGVGLAEYGDIMFHQTQSELRREMAEELADAVNRIVAILRCMVETSPAE
jgi:type III secretion system FlhB-like substrate exporter